MGEINKEIIKFSGIFENKEPRIINGYISVLDIIQHACGISKNSVHNTWKRIKEQYEEVLTNCKDLKFKGAGQRETPCINLLGFTKLMMILPGKLSAKFRSDAAPIIIRHLGGDITLINEIKVTNNLHIQNGENDIFRQAIKTRKLLYDERYHMYVRVWSPFFEDQQKNLKCDEKVIKLGLDKIKFGIAKYLDGRESSYGNDYGYFQFSIELPNKDCALFIEKIARQEFKDLTVGNTYEYLYSKKLAKYFKIIKSTKSQLEKRDYYLVAKKLYSKMISDFHMYYPNEKDNFGILNHPKVEEDYSITNSVITLSEDKLPDYILKECIIENEIKVEKEIKKEIIELNENDINLLNENEKLNNELRLEKVKTKNVLNLIEKEAPKIFAKFIEKNIKNEEHHNVWKKNRIFQYSLDGKYIKEFDSIMQVAKNFECSTKLIRSRVQNKKCFNGFLWRSSNDVKNKNDLPIKTIDKCDLSDYHVLKTFNNFEEIKKEFKKDKKFDINEVYRSIEFGLIYYGFRWKFKEEEIVIGKQLGRTGTNKRIAKLNIDKEILEFFPNLKEAAENINISNGHLSFCANNNKLCGGFYWEYVI